LAGTRNPKGKVKGKGKGKGKGQGRGGDRDQRAGRPRFKRKRRVCRFCVDKKDTLNYQDVGLVRRFVTDRGKIAPRRLSGCCAMHQRMIARAIKRARVMGLVPYSVE